MRRSLKVTCERLKWWFTHRFVKEHQYHLIRPKNLTPGYHEIPERGIHALFQLTEEYIDCYCCCDVVKHRQIVKLYDWWRNRDYYRDKWLEEQTNRLNELEERAARTVSILGVWERPADDTPEYKEWSNIAHSIYDQEEKWRKEDRQKLIEIAGLLEYMIT